MPVRMPDWNAKMPTVPVDKDGNWLNYPHHWQAVGWEPADKFWAVMKILRMETGRSSKILVLQDINTNKTYPMFVADLVKGIQKGLLDSKGTGTEGYLTANWTASKRGANYGIKAV